MARASTAAILVEAKAAETDPNTAEEPNLIDHEVETDAAKYRNGEVFLKGNPLITTPEVHCPKCGKPRLLYPTDGNRARRPDPNVDYCKKHPYIEKPYHDVYGQVYQPDGPGRGKKKKDMNHPLLNGSTANGNQDSPPADITVPKLLNFPTGKCVGCGNAIMIKRLNGHMAKCMGGGGRESSRNANLKMQNGGNGTPPGSRTGTPAPSNTSSNKRDREDDDSDSSPHKKSKKNGKDGGLKKTAVSKKLRIELKPPKMAKSASQQRESNLSFEEKAPGLSDSEEDDKDGEYGSTISADPAKKKSKVSTNGLLTGKKLVIKDKKKWLHGKGGVKALEPPDTKPLAKIKTDMPINGKVKLEIGDSESSQTLSSPN